MTLERAIYERNYLWLVVYLFKIQNNYGVEEFKFRREIIKTRLANGPRKRI